MDAKGWEVAQEYAAESDINIISLRTSLPKRGQVVGHGRCICILKERLIGYDVRDETPPDGIADTSEVLLCQFLLVQAMKKREAFESIRSCCTMNYESHVWISPFEPTRNGREVASAFVRQYYGDDSTSRMQSLNETE